MTQFVNAKGTAGIYGTSVRYSVAKDFDAAFNYERGIKTFKSNLPVTNSVESNRYDRMLRFATERKWYSKEEADWYRVFDAFQNRDEYILSPQQKRFFDDIDQRFAENRQIEIRQGNLEVKELADSYMPHWWRGFEDDAEVDEVGRRLFSSEQKIAVWGREDFEFKREYPHMRFAVNKSISDALKQVDPKDISMLRLHEGIEHPMDLVARRIQDGQERLQEKIFLSELKKRTSLAADQPMFISPNEAKSIRALMAGESDLPGVVGAVVDAAAVVTDQIRALRFTMDLGILGVQGAIGTFPYLLANPAWTIKTYWHALNSVVTEPERWLVANQDRLLRARRDGMTFALAARDIKGKALVEKPKFLPKPGGGWFNPLHALNNVQFGRILLSIKLDAYEMNREMLMQGSPINKALSALSGKEVRGLSGIEAGRRSASHVNALFGGLNVAELGLGSGVMQLSKLLFNTPQFFIGTTQVALRGASLGPESVLARGFLVRLYAASAALVAAVNTSQGESFQVLNPDDPDWMMIKIGNTRISPLGRFRAYAKLAYAGVTDLVHFTTGQDESIDIDRAALRFMLGRSSIYAQSARVMISQEDFLGEPLFEHSGPSLRTKETWSIIGQQLLSPIGIGQVAEDARFHRGSVGNALLSFMGVTSFNVDPAVLRAKAVYTEEIVNALTDPKIVGEAALSPTEARKRAAEAVRLNRPYDAFLIPGTKEKIGKWTSRISEDIDHQVATRLGYMRPEGDGIVPDTDLARRLGRGDKRTNQEQTAFEKDIVDNFIGKNNIDLICRAHQVGSVE